MNHRLAVPHHGHTFLHKSVEQFSMDVSMFIEISSINIFPIKPYPVKT